MAHSGGHAVLVSGLPGGTSFMEDYTYHLEPGNQKSLGAHMLEVCPTISSQRPYHAATSPERTLEIMQGMVDNAIDRNCFDAIRSVLKRELG